jgi:hypothetical protein
VSGLDCLAFLYFAELSGLVPIVGVNAGYCFAGNAAILGCCDVVIATEDSNIGMGGPAMIEGGGLGVFDPHDIGPIEVQRANGVVDIVVPDEAAAVAAAKQYLGYFQGAVDEWSCADRRELRHVIPEDRKRSYDVHRVIQGMFDTGSVLELRRHFGLGMVTALARVLGYRHRFGLRGDRQQGAGGEEQGSERFHGHFLLETHSQEPVYCESFALARMILRSPRDLARRGGMREQAAVPHTQRTALSGRPSFSDARWTRVRRVRTAGKRGRQKSGQTPSPAR